MRRVILTSLTAASMGFSAYAADLPVRGPAYTPPSPVALAPSWTGFYVGANGGWGWSSFGTAFVPDPNGAFVAPDDMDLAGPESFNTRVNGAVFGGQIGYNWQMGNWVLGVEGDFDGAGISGAQQIVGGSPDSPGLPTTNVVSASQRVDWLASIRGRVGVLWGPGLLYFTGGGAWEGVTRNQSVSVFGDTAVSNVSSTRSGLSLAAAMNGRSLCIGPCEANICSMTSVVPTPTPLRFRIATWTLPASAMWPSPPARTTSVSPASASTTSSKEAPSWGREGPQPRSGRVSSQDPMPRADNSLLQSCRARQRSRMPRAVEEAPEFCGVTLRSTRLTGTQSGLRPRPPCDRSPFRMTNLNPVI